ncbi:hypothetical protein FVE85_8828 [Porphyridium purpureum]|uniref:Uncharacterized protein n=1 Tax=Porphyridium purpureum TaxID=35688 RepID=A0A5J4YRH0_PORPP|nr:hypothetical protein FVE85_8828 [Porphyridium purpureum]|eukprot:POR3102..scf296_7
MLHDTKHLSHLNERTPDPMMQSWYSAKDERQSKTSADMTFAGWTSKQQVEEPGCGLVLKQAPDTDNPVCVKRSSSLPSEQTPSSMVPKERVSKQCSAGSIVLVGTDAQQSKVYPRLADIFRTPIIKYRGRHSSLASVPEVENSELDDDIEPLGLEDGSIPLQSQLKVFAP